MTAATPRPWRSDPEEGIYDTISASMGIIADDVVRVDGADDEGGVGAHDDLVGALQRLTQSTYLIRRRDTDCYCDESPHTDRCGSLIHDREQARALLRALDAASQQEEGKE